MLLLLLPSSRTGRIRSRHVTLHRLLLVLRSSASRRTAHARLLLISHARLLLISMKLLLLHELILILLVPMYDCWVSAVAFAAVPAVGDAAAVAAAVADTYLDYSARSIWGCILRTAHLGLYIAWRTTHLGLHAALVHWEGNLATCCTVPAD
jgi:hypothetical protein